MKRKLYLDIALLVVILGVCGVFVFMQHAPATDTPTQDVTAGCCGGSKVEGETPQTTVGGCCGIPATETAKSDNVSKSDNVLQQVQTQETSETDKAVQASQSEKADTGGCGCGSQ